MVYAVRNVESGEYYRLRADTSVKVLSIGTMKPFDYKLIANLAAGMKAVVTAEEHSYIGGLAAATALALRESTVPMDYLAVNDVFGESAHKVEDLHVAYGLTAENLAGKAGRLVHGRKS